MPPEEADAAASAPRPLPWYQLGTPTPDLSCVPHSNPDGTVSVVLSHSRIQWSTENNSALLNEDQLGACSTGNEDVKSFVTEGNLPPFTFLLDHENRTKLDRQFHDICKAELEAGSKDRTDFLGTTCKGVALEADDNVAIRGYRNGERGTVHYIKDFTATYYFVPKDTKSPAS